MQPESGRRWLSTLPVAIGLVLVMILAACGANSTTLSEVATDGDEEAVATSVPAPAAAQDTSAPSTDAALPAMGEVAPELAPLGNLVSLNSNPVTQVFGPDGGSLTLADGATVTVPTGAFAAPTEVTIVLADLNFRYLEDAPEGRLYQLSTVEDLTLAQPLVIDVPKASESVTVSELTNGAWVDEALLNSPTTQIEITQFSTVIHSVIDRADCAIASNASLCETPGQGYGDWRTVSSTAEVGDVSVPNELCSICPSRTATALDFDAASTDDSDSSDSSGSSDSDSDSSGSQGSTPSPTATSTPSSSSGSSGSSSSCESGYSKNSRNECISPNYNCIHPAIEHYNQQTCMVRNECGPSSSGYRIDSNYKCVYEGQNCQQGYTYKDNKCRTPRYNCEYPNLDFRYENGCRRANDCQGSGYSISGTDCNYQPQNNCQQGYTYKDNKCRTPRYNCEYPNLDFRYENGCRRANDCQGSGYSISGTDCNYQPQNNCEQGYTYKNGKCRSPQYDCEYPRLDYPHERGCRHPSDCSGNGYSISGTTCNYQQQNCQQGYVLQGGECNSPEYGCAYPKLDYARYNGCLSQGECQGSGHSIHGSECRYEEPDCQQGYTYSNGECRTSQYNCDYPKLDFPHENGCRTASQCQGQNYRIVGTTCEYNEDGY